MCSRLVSCKCVPLLRCCVCTRDAGSCFNPASCLELVLPWLLQQGPVGWKTADTLADKANAVNAALAVVRLGLLRERAAAGGNTLGAASKQQLQSTLSVLSAAVKDALQALQAVNRLEQAAEAAAQDSAADGRVQVPGEAQGSGEAVDAWLAVSRVQDVLDRVLELLH